MSRRTSRSTFAPALFMLAILFLSIFASWLELIPPAVLPATAPAREFSARRAFAHMQAMAVGPHWTGSQSNARVGEYIADQMRLLGLEVQIQPVQSFFDNGATATVHNVIGRMRGTGGTKAVLFNVHYDGVASSPGASYSAYVAAFLETIRAIRADPAPRNDLIFIFNDGEEWGFMGARGFVNEHPWAREVGLVVEGIPRGTGGPVFLATTSDRNGWLARQTIAALPYAVTHSITRDAYALLPGGGDLEVYQEAGMPGLMLTWQQGHVTYHAMTDTIQNVDLRSVQQLGASLLSLARRFGSLDLAALPQEPNRVYFNLFRWEVIQYPGTLVVPFAVLAVLLYGALLLTGFRRHRLAARGIGAGLLATPLSIAGAYLIAALLWMAVTALLHPPLVSLAAAIPYNPDLYALAFTGFSVAFSAWLFVRLRHRFDAQSLAAGGLAWWALLTLLAAFAMPGASYLFTWPLVFGALGLVTRPSDIHPGSIWKQAGTLAMLAIPTLLIVVPVIYLFYTGMLFSLGLPGLVPFFVGLLVWGLIPQLDLLTHPDRGWIWRGAALTGLIFLLAAILTTKSDAAHPRPYYLIYGLDADSGEAFWFSDDPEVDAWVSGFFESSPSPDDFRGFYAFDWLQEGSDFVRSPAPPATIEAPRVEVISDTSVGEIRTLILRIASSRGAAMVNAFLQPEIPVISASLDGTPFYSGDVHTPARLPVHHWTVPEGGFELTLQVPAGEAVALVVADESAGLPGSEGLTARPADLMVPPQSWFLFGDSTWVKKTYRFGGGQP